MSKVLNEVCHEREYQNQRFGTAFDDKNTLNDWSAYITRYLGNATFATTREEQRCQLIKVAALAVAAVEAFDRNLAFPPRHYDAR